MFFSYGYMNAALGSTTSCYVRAPVQRIHRHAQRRLDD
jgi:hypothetical protein